MKTIGIAVLFIIGVALCMALGIFSAHYASSKGWLTREEIALGECADSGADFVVIDGNLMFECEVKSHE